MADTSLGSPSGCDGWLLVCVGAPLEATRGAEPTRPFGPRLGRALRALRLVFGCRKVIVSRVLTHHFP